MRLSFQSKGSIKSGKEKRVFKTPRMFVEFVVRPKLHGLVWSVRNSSELAPATHDLGDPAPQAMSPGRDKGASTLKCTPKLEP